MWVFREKVSKLFFLIGLANFFTAAATQKPLMIITASYNNSAWCQKYFSSIAQQDYDNWQLMYIDDNSTDDTVSQIEQLIAEYHLEHKVIVVKNQERMGHLYNQYCAIHSCHKDHIILIIDGDDWLAHEHVFQTINTAYQNEHTWLTYGQFWYWKKNKKGLCRAFPSETIKNNAFREISWRTSHLRTFYAGLFQLIKYEDLLYQGALFPKCVDVATMFPMLEMAGTHIHFIPELLYIYNDDNPISYHHDPSHQREIEAYIRKMPRYEPLKDNPW